MEDTTKNIQLPFWDHVLLRSSNYIGTSCIRDTNLYLLNNEDKYEFGTINVNPILFNCIDELITNATDLKIKNANVTSIGIKYDINNITIYNNGRGFDVNEGKTCKDEKGILHYSPEGVFVLERCGSNFENTSMTGGMNGLGAKLALVYSKEINIWTQNKGTSYRQRIVMKEKPYPDLPIIETGKNIDDNFTMIKFTPDYNKINKTTIMSIEPLIRRRMLDIIALFPGINIIINDKKYTSIPFPKFIDTYFLKESDKYYIQESSCIKSKIQYVVIMNKNHNISYVNGMYTEDGGEHEKYIMKEFKTQLVNRYLERDKACKENKKYYDVVVKNTSLFIILFMFNPQYDGQLKAKLLINPSDLPRYAGFDNKILDEMIKNRYEPLFHKIEMEAKNKEFENSLKSRINKKNGNIKDIKDHIPAKNWRRSGLSTLILCEGGSALGTAKTGLKSLGETVFDVYGTYSLTGKILNVAKSSMEHFVKSKKIQDLILILGIFPGIDYSIDDNYNKLYYKNVLIFTDADPDGAHIQGLVITMFRIYWPELLKRIGYLSYMKSPYIRIYGGKNILKEYYSIDQFVNDKDKPKGIVNYYKGIGSHKDNEIKKVFKNIENNRVYYVYKDGDFNLIDTIFGPNIDMRKAWMIKCKNEKKYNQAFYEDTKVSYSTFCDVAMGEHASYNLERSIPSCIDGLKICHRKILYIMTDNKKYEVRSKLSDIVGNTIKKTHYNHGNVSLEDAIARMSQRVTGINNINLIEPESGLGTRENLEPGQPRYCYAKLAAWTNLIYRKEDKIILENKMEEDTKLEYNYFIPIIPVVLVNGTDGIGTGWSTKVPKFKPTDIIIALKNRIEKGKSFDCPLWYANYTTNSKNIKGRDKYYCCGDYTVNSRDYNGTPLSIEINELPACGLSYEKYIKYLDELKDRPSKHGKDNKLEEYITGYYPRNIPNENHMTHLIVNFSTNFTKLLTKANENELIEKVFQIRSTVSTKNMMLFDELNNLHHFKSVEDIFEYFYEFRLRKYNERKKKQLEQMKLNIINKKYKKEFIKAVINDIIIGKKLSSSELVTAITKYFTGLGWDIVKDLGADPSYKMLTKIPYNSQTLDKYKKLEDELAVIEKEYDNLDKTDVKTIWVDELKELYMAIKDIL